MRFSVRWEIFIAEYNVKEDFLVGVFLFFIGYWDMTKFQTTVSFDAHTVPAAGGESESFCFPFGEIFTLHKPR